MRYLLSLLLLACVPASGLAEKMVSSVEDAAPAIFLAGDSTMADKPKLEFPERGWGQLFRELVRPPAKIENHARNGRSTKSFIDEGLWDKLIARVRTGDWVIIQFGHNDEKTSNPKVYTAPREAYRDNLLRFIQEVRARGAHPVLATSVARRSWDASGTLVPSHGEYPEMVRELAAQQKVPMLELEKLTSDLEHEYGVEDSKRLHLWFPAGALPEKPEGLQDDMHYSELGARRVAALAAREIHRLELPIAEWITVPDTTVATDGSGDYTSLEKAIYKAPMRTGRNDRPWLIRLKAGVYRERVYVQRERGNIIVRGDDPLTTVISGDLHSGMEGIGGKPVSTFDSATLWVDGDGMTWENVTVANTAGAKGPALALRADGDQLVFRHCRFLGDQDTLLLNRGRHYLEDCYIEGRVDFIFGGATAYFSRCHIHCLGNGYITAASTPESMQQGFVFADCRITGEEGSQSYLGRPWRNYARALFLRTEMAGVIRSEGWHNWNNPSAEQTTHYGEQGSTGPGASPDTRVRWAKDLSQVEADALTPGSVLSAPDGWNPLSH